MGVSSPASVHIDFQTADAINLQLFLTSPGPLETPYTLTVTQGEWVSVDI